MPTGKRLALAAFAIERGLGNADCSDKATGQVDANTQLCNWKAGCIQKLARRGSHDG